MEKTVFITRGTSSSGKTTFAETIKSLNPEAVICCADDYFTDDEGNYNFDVSKIKNAHAYCRGIFDDSIKGGVQTIVVANTNTQEWEFSEYHKKAEENGYLVHVVVVEKRHNNTNDHGVPSDVIKRHEENIINSLKLT